MNLSEMHKVHTGTTQAFEIHSLVSKYVFSYAKYITCFSCITRSHVPTHTQSVPNLESIIQHIHVKV